MRSARNPGSNEALKRERTYVRLIEKEEDFLAITGPTDARVSHLLQCVYQDKARAAGGAGTLHVSVERIPKSLNHQYVRRGQGRSYDLEPEIKLLRDELALKLAPARNVYRPKGVLAAIVVFRSPLWVTKENCVRDMDWDNKVKPLFDAFEKATGIRDCRFWAGHVFKEVGASDRTTLSVFDLGDIVERAGG